MLSAYLWAFFVCYNFFVDDSVGARFGKLDYALGTLERAVPDDIPFRKTKIRDYITALRQTLAQAMDETTLPARAEPPGGWTESAPLKSTKMDGQSKLYPGVFELSATITYQDVISRSDGNNKQYNVISAHLELHVTSVFIKTGPHWYPYDLMPAIACRSGSKEALLSDGDLSETATQ